MMLEAVEDRTVDTLHSYNGPGGIAIGLEALRGLGWTTSGLRLAHGYGLTPTARHTLTHLAPPPGARGLARAVKRALSGAR